MQSLRQLFKLKKTACSLISGLMLAGLLGGCKFIEVSVQVDTCQSDGTRMPLPDPGACNVVNPYTGAIPPPPATICKNIGGQTIPCPANATCSSGAKCGDPPGSYNRKTCKTIWTESSAGSTSGSCLCTSAY